MRHSVLCSTRASGAHLLSSSSCSSSFSCSVLFSKERMFYVPAGVRHGVTAQIGGARVQAEPSTATAMAPRGTAPRSVVLPLLAPRAGCAPAVPTASSCRPLPVCAGASETAPARGIPACRSPLGPPTVNFAGPVLAPAAVARGSARSRTAVTRAALICRRPRKEHGSVHHCGFAPQSYGRTYSSGQAWI